MTGSPQLKILRSRVAANWLAELIETEYELGGAVAGKLFYSGDNDIYLITVGETKYVARIYRYGKPWITSETDYHFELEWLNYLKGQGVPVSYPIQRRDGDYLGHLHAAEGLRHYALFSFAEGQAGDPISEEQSYRYGAGVAQIHLLSNEFQSQHKRFTTDLTFLLDNPLQWIKNLLADRRAQDLDFLVDAIGTLKKQVTAILEGDDAAIGTMSADAWGIIGGDCHFLNAHFNADNDPIFFDFDFCSYGWRVYDIAVFLWDVVRRDAPPEIASSFLAGYQSVRPLSEAELKLLSPLMAIRHIFVTGTVMRIAHFNGDLWFDDATLDQAFNQIKKLMEMRN